MSAAPLAERLAAAFNARDAHAMAGLLDPQASAEVLGSGLPVEQGPAAIRATSFAYLLRADPVPLRAEARVLDGTAYVLLGSPADPADVACAVRVVARGGRILRMAYLVPAHREAAVAAIRAAAGRARGSAGTRPGPPGIARRSTPRPWPRCRDRRS